MSDIDRLSEMYDALRGLFPGLPARASVRLAGEGFSSIAVSVEEKWIFRIGRNTETLARHEREWAILPQLRASLPLPIPEPCWHAGPTEAFPFGVIGYPLLPGIPWTLEMAAKADLDRLARQLGEFLSALHAFPADEALAAGVERKEPAHALVDELLPELPTLLDTHTCDLFTQWWDEFLASPERNEFTPVLLHGDLWCENILLAPDLSRAVGVVDFEQVRIGDPVSEFAALRYLGDEFTAQVKAHYTPAAALQPHFEDRLRAAVILRELDGLRYALRYPESGEFEDAVEKVANVLR